MELNTTVRPHLLFKQCPKCDMVWPDRDTFLNDEEIELVGYQVNFKELKTGLFLFNHLPCETTLSIKAELFLDLYRGEIFRDRLTGTDQCPGFCLYENNLMPCPAKCECSYVRSVLHSIRQIRKKVEFNL